MPTRPTKGDHGHRDSGSGGRGGQKATYGSAVSEDVAEESRGRAAGDVANQSTGEERDAPQA